MAESTDKKEVIPNDITNVVANAKTPKTKFAVLKTLIEAVEISDRDILDTVFNLVSMCMCSVAGLLACWHCGFFVTGNKF